MKKHRAADRPDSHVKTDPQFPQRSVPDEIRYSQNDEQRVIVDFFAGQIGRFLDIGAYNGRTFSNTRRLLELGWDGVLVEPCPSVIGALRNNVMEFGSKAVVLECAVTSKNGRVKFYDDGGGAVATTSSDHALKWPTARYIETEVDSVTPDTLLNMTEGDFDFVKIDTEGTNVEIVRLMPWDRLARCRLICAEHESNDDAIVETLEPLGFKGIARNGENLILAR